MNLRTVSWLVGVVLGAVTLAEAPALVAALIMGEPWLGFAVSMALGAGGTFVLTASAQREQVALDHRSAILGVGVAGISACVLGAIPLVEHPELGISWIDALFESSSGFTTTGATVLSGLDHAPRSVLLWRALMHWLGGMGMVVLAVAILPILGLGGMQLFRQDAPGPTKDTLTPRIAKTAQILWMLYLGLTLSLGLLLYLGGMTAFDALCHALSTIATGGFSTHDLSLGYYDSSFLNMVTVVFMLLGGASFAILHRAMTQGSIQWRAQPELRLYLGVFVAAALLLSFDLRSGLPGQYPDAASALEHAVFQAASVQTGTGFFTADFASWPPLSHAVFLALFFLGGMAGSTVGGIKLFRVLILARLGFSQFFRLVHPRGVGVVRLGARVLDDQIVLGVLGFVAIWWMLVLAGTFALAISGFDMFTSFSAAISTLGNIGPGLGGVGPTHTYAAFPPAAKLVMSALMILGSLEVFSLLVILTPGFWRA